MKYVDEFRNPTKAQGIVEKIRDLGAQLTQNRPWPHQNHGGLRRPYPCHLQIWARRSAAPQREMVHGPGCPVCIMPRGRLDDAIAIAQHPEVIFTTFGDAMRVPGSRLSLLQAKAEGADIRMVYSPLDALTLAKANPDRQVVFFAIGFETTAPSTALTVLQAQKEGIENFSLFSNHVLVVPALEALLANPDLQLDGFVGPGHVSMVIGTQPYQLIADRYHKPVVVSGLSRWIYSSRSGWCCSSWPKDAASSKTSTAAWPNPPAIQSLCRL
jgi:hydrogenase expression/formation protein HypD